MILRLVVVAAIAGGSGWGGKLLWKQVSPGLFGNKREDKIPTARVKTASISEEIVAVGRLRAVFSTELRAEISGRITKISVFDGQAVKRDAEILRLDQQDVLTQIQESDRNIEASKLKMQKAKRDFERQQDLQSRGLVAIRDYEEARTALSLAENDAAVFSARAANLRDKLAKTIIRAPHDGTLLLRRQGGPPVRGRHGPGSSDAHIAASSTGSPSPRRPVSESLCAGSSYVCGSAP
jgi:multidrug efflux pump subunit AcrA (membrane-fusion protein)